MLQKARAGFGQTIFEKLTKSQRGECSLCYEEMLPGDTIIQLACYETHKFHEACYNNFAEFSEKNNTPLLCPLCRAPVKQDQIVKKEL